MENRHIADEMNTLLRQLVMQDQIRMAGLVLQTYFVRNWKVEESLAKQYVRGYFAKYYPKQLERHLKRMNQAS